MMIKALYATAILAGIGSVAQAGKLENFDFAKSACAAKASGFEKAIAIRVLPHMSGDSKFSLRDGKTEWEKSFGLLSPDEIFQFVSRATFDGWAVYQLHVGHPSNISVQYMFGDVSPAPRDCLIAPESPEPVSVFEMAPIAVQMYLERLTGDGSGSPDQMRRRLLELLERPAEQTTATQSSKSAAAAPSPTSGTTIANACGVPVQSALVEIGQHQPPKVFTPDVVAGRWEFNHLSEGDEPLSAMCFRTKEESSLFRVPLPAGLTSCVFDEGALSCSRSAKATVQSGPDVNQLSAEEKARLDKAAEALTNTDPYSQALLEEPKARIEPNDFVGERPSLEGLPTIVGEEFVKWDSGCGQNANGSFSDDYLTMADVDGDGRPDFILNGDGATCVQNGKTVSMGGGNGGTSLKIFTRKGSSLTKTLSIFTQGAEVHAYKGFAVVTTAEGRTYKLANGKATKAKIRPKGGKVVYTLGR